MNRIAKFEKVSLEQFREGWTDTFGPADEGVIEGIYGQIRLPERATVLLRQTSCWSREKQ